MKVIELLTKIANGEEVPKKFMVDGDTLYIGEDKFIEYANGERIEWFIYPSWLNEEIEIIEEDSKIQHIGANNYEWNYKYPKDTPQAVVDNLELVRQKINEITDKINKEK